MTNRIRVIVTSGCILCVGAGWSSGRPLSVLPAAQMVYHMVHNAGEQRPCRSRAENGCSDAMFDVTISAFTSATYSDGTTIEGWTDATWSVAADQSSVQSGEGFDELAGAAAASAAYLGGEAGYAIGAEFAMDAGVAVAGFGASTTTAVVVMAALPWATAAVAVGVAAY
jgi:hypothetical protein